MSSPIKTDSVHLYTHTALNQYYDNEIRLYGIDKQKKNVCLRIQDFKPYIYLEVDTKCSDEDLYKYLQSSHYRKIVIRREHTNLRLLTQKVISELKPREYPKIENRRELQNYIQKYRDYLPNFIRCNCWVFSLIRYSVSSEYKEKLYYANGLLKNDGFKYRKYRCVKLEFKDANSIYNFVNIIKEDKGNLVCGFTKEWLCYKDNPILYYESFNSKRNQPNIPVKVHEHVNNLYLQFLSNYDIPSTGWINYKYREHELICDVDKKTLCDIEVIVKSKNLSKNNQINQSVSPCIVSFDIEVYSSQKNSFPKAENLEDCIFQISAVVQHPDKKIEKILFCLKPDHTEFDFKLEDAECRFYLDEGRMITGFRNFLLKLKPHLVIGYNIMGFDLEYILTRDNEKHGVNVTTNLKFQQHGFYKYKLDPTNRYTQAPVKVVDWSSSAYKNQKFTWVEAEGMIYIDLLPLVKRDYRLRRYNLKTVAKEFLTNIEKDPLTVKDIFDGYRIGIQMKEEKYTLKERIEKLKIVGKYCVQDSYVVLRLFNKLDYWIGLSEMARVCNVPIYHLYTKGQQIKIFSQVYKYCTEQQIIVDMDGYMKKRIISI